MAANFTNLRTCKKRNGTVFYTNINDNFINYNNNKIMTNNVDNFHYSNTNRQEQQQPQQQHHNNSSSMRTYEFFDYICVIDFEATCIETNPLDYPHEIIEFPIVLINMKTMQIEDTFQQYVRPVINPRLSKYCHDLTGITQEQVDQADVFPEVFKRAKEWLHLKQLGSKYRFAIASDGPWDFEKFLNLQCYYSSSLFPFWASRWIDVRQLFAEWFGLRRCNIINMLNYFGFNFEGKQHCGLDDARNIARIFIKLVEIGCPISFNGNIRKCKSVIEKYPYSSQFNGFIDA